MAGHFWKKRLFGKTFFTTVLSITREMSETKSKNPGKMCRLIFLNIHPQYNANNVIKILHLFTRNVKPYIQLHI